MRTKITPFVLLLSVCLATSCDSTSSNTEMPADQLTLQDVAGLKTVAPYPIGVATGTDKIIQAGHQAIINHAFNNITAEWEMKMNPISTGVSTYDWRRPDAIVNFAEENGFGVHGHTLIWHTTTPAWIQNYTGDDNAFEEAVERYITDVMTRYKGRVASWDVVNEVFEDGSGALRQSEFQQRMGDDFVARLFEYAHAADPDALLFYNDYGTIWDSAKRQAMLNMVDDLLARGIPIHGVGLQMHITIDFPAISEIVATMQAISDRGLKVHISELDVRVNPDGDISRLTTARSEAQKARVKELIQAFNNLPEEHRFAVTMWGVRDSESWLINFWGNPEWPLLFDDLFNPKPAYVGFLEALQEAG